VRRVRSRESDAFERLALISSRLMSMMTDLRTLMSNQKDCSGDRLMLSIVRMNSWEHLWDDKSLIISNESRTVYKFSVHSSTKAMTTDYEYERSSSYREKWWYRDIIMMLSWQFFLEKNLILINYRLVFFEKTETHRNRSMRLKIKKRLEISDSILMSSKSLIRKRRNFCSWWTSRW
jgi:hypothetical protein